MKSGRRHTVDSFEKSLEVGDRIRQIRECFGLTQEQLAQYLIVTRERVANFETGRTPLPLRLALEICEVFIISERWLATGEGLMRQHMDLSHDPITKKVHENLDYIVAFESVLNSRYEAALRQCPNGIRFTPSGERPILDRNLLDCFLHLWTAWLPCGESNARLIRSIIDLGNEYCQNPRNLKGALPESDVFEILSEQGLPIGDERFLAAYREAEKMCRNPLTDVAASGNMPPVKSLLKHLLIRLERVTVVPGSKTSLADSLGVPLTSVSRWLSGEREPGGETTLRLLQWVEQQERQQNTLDSDTNTAKGKTQVHKSKTNEKANSNPPKR